MRPIVRGDGTLMGIETAGQRPVETILSGPAASVVGALALTGYQDGVVIDVGGTTTDIAGVEGGMPCINQSGASVGGLTTQVEAIDIPTMGLGGDSLIRFGRNGKLEIGPRCPSACCPALTMWQRHCASCRAQVSRAVPMNCSPSGR